MKYIVGLGHVMRGDDGIGSQIIQTILKQQLEHKLLKHKFCAIDLASNIWGLLSLLNKDSTKILILDCAYLGQKPGAWQFFSLNQILDQENNTVENHEISLIQLIALAKKADYSIPPIYLMGIEPAQVKFGAPLSTMIEKQISVYVNEAIHFL